MQLGFVIDHARCIGCHACTVACKSENDVPLGKFRTWVKYTETGTFPTVRRSFAVLRCNQCTDAPCVAICPVSAIDKSPHTGIVDVDPDVCIGCKACMQGCPYDAIYLNEDEGTVQKCHFCAHRVEQGLAPACAVVCPTEAIIPGDFHDPDSVVSRLKAAGGLAARKTEAGTSPNVLYREAAPAGLDPLSTNAGGGFLWAQQLGGVQMDAEIFAALDAQARGAAGADGAGTASVAHGTVHGAVHGAAPAAQGTAHATRGYSISPHGLPTSRTVYDTAHPPPWGGKITGYLFFKSLAAGVFLAGTPLLQPLATEGRAAPVAVPLLALLALAVTMVLLVADLKRPARFWLILVRPNWSSWLATGSYILMVYGLLLVLWLGLGLRGAVLPSEGAGTLAAFTDLFAGLAAAYTGWLFGQAKGRVLWMKRGLWLHLLVQAAVGGSALLVALGPLLGLEVPAISLLGNVLFGSLAAHLFFILVEGRLAPRGREAEYHRAARLLTRGPFAQVHWAYGVGAGILLPLLLLLVVDGTFAWAFAGVLALVGLWVEEDLTVRAGQALPIS